MGASFDRRELGGEVAAVAVGGLVDSCEGNHDPELHHPATRDVFLDALALPDHPGFTVHTADAPWTTVIGGLPVRVGHGHRVADPWNDIDPEAVLRAVETAPRVALPPGSRLVLELLNPLKLAVHRSTGAQRFPFLDLLKPERATVTLLLPYLDWRAAEAKIGTFSGLLAQRFLRRFERAIRRRPVLGPETAADPAVELDEMLADALVETLPEEERRAPDATVRTLRTLLSGGPAAAPGTLAAHGGLLRKCAMEEVRTNTLVTSGYRLTREDVARVRLLRERMSEVMQGGERSPELRRLAVESLETLSGPDWAEKMRQAVKGSRSLRGVGLGVVIAVDVERARARAFGLSYREIEVPRLHGAALRRILAEQIAHLDLSRELDEAARLALLHAADGLPGKLLAMLRRLPLPGYWHDGGPRLSLLQTDAGVELVETLLRRPA